MTVKSLLRRKDAVESHLEIFDELDYNVFNKQDWNRLPESHDDYILVTWPDGRQTRGLAQHIEDLKEMFSYAPDTKIISHPIRFGQEDLTCVVGKLTGTFTQPMRTPDGGVIQPTGKSFEITMVTVARWKNGKMIEEILMWDNLAFMQQIGLEPRFETPARKAA